MEIAYFNIKDLAERVNHLLALRTANRDQFDQNQLHSIASSVVASSRFSLYYPLHPQM